MSHTDDTTLTGGRHPLVEILAIAAPTVATMLTYTILQFIDAIMVSRIQPASPVYVTAQGNGGMWAWIAMSFAVGLTGVVNTYVSQYMGKGEPRKGAAYAWAGNWFSLGFWLLLIPYAVALPVLFERILGHSGQTLRLETSYAQICIMGGVFMMLARSTAQFFFGLHKASVPLIAACSAILINIGANWVLIYGNLGVTAMGVTGAAIGTALGSLSELLVLLAVFLSPKYAKAFGSRETWRPSWRPIKDIFKLGFPAGAMIVNEMVCWGYFMTALLPRAGAAAGESPDVHNAVGWIALRYMHLAFMPAVGMSIALTAIVGRFMGMGRPDLAAKRTWLGVWVTMTYMAICALLMVVFRDRAVEQFIDEGTDPEIAAQMIALGARIMIVGAIFQVFDAMGMAITGALRGAGDTLWTGVVFITLSWTIIIGGGHLMIARFPELGSLGPWIATAAYIIMLGAALLVRFMGGKWKSIQVVRHEGEPSLTQTLAGEDLTVSPDAMAGVSPGSP